MLLPIPAFACPRGSSDDSWDGNSLDVILLRPCDAARNRQICRPLIGGASMSNRMVKLAQRPVGMAKRENFSIEDGPVPQPGAGEFRVKVEYISLDPAMRGWMNDAKSYVAPVGIGDVMRAYAVGTIEASNNP